jgi:hypothetical protein
VADIRDFRGKGQLPANIAQQARLPIDPSKMSDIVCLDCGNKEFVTVFTMKYLSKIQSPNGQEGLVNFNETRCRKCEKSFNMKEWKDSLDAKPVNSEEVNEE